MREFYVAIERDEDGNYVGEVPQLTACYSQGRSKEEAIANIVEAIRGYIAALQEDGLPIPAENFDTMVVAV